MRSYTTLAVLALAASTVSPALSAPVKEVREPWKTRSISHHARMSPEFLAKLTKLAKNIIPTKKPYPKGTLPITRPASGAAPAPVPAAPHPVQETVSTPGHPQEPGPAPSHPQEIQPEPAPSHSQEIQPEPASSHSQEPQPEPAPSHPQEPNPVPSQPASTWKSKAKNLAIDFGVGAAGTLAGDEILNQRPSAANSTNPANATDSVSPTNPAGLANSTTSTYLTNSTNSTTPNNSNNSNTDGLQRRSLVYGKRLSHFSRMLDELD